MFFIAFSICLFCVANSVFDSTEQGVETSYVSSFTGDFIIRPTTKGQFSLFGDETPITGSFTRLATVVPYNDIQIILQNMPVVESVVPQLTGTAAMEFNGSRYATVLFGVDAKKYLSLMSSIIIEDGFPYDSNSKGMMISSALAAKTGIKTGDSVQFVISDGPYFRIRKAQVTAIYSYKVDNPILERFVLVNPQTVAELMEVQSASEEIDIASEKTALLDNDLDFDSLFDFTEDFIVEDDVLDVAPEIVSEAGTKGTEMIEGTDPYFSNSTWHYIIGRTQNQKSAQKTIRNLNRNFRKNRWPVQAVDWRHAAGSTALYLYWLRIILNIGIVIVLFAGFIIVNNSLTVNVIDRTREMGTMRAIGASKKYIAVECMAETCLLSVCGGLFGITLGFIACAFINRMNLQFTNQYLVQLFGSGVLSVHVTVINVLKLVLISVIIGLFSWIYPVINVLHITPLQAMEGTK